MSQILLAVLDLIGVAIVGAIGAIAVAGVQSQDPPQSFSKILELSGTAESSIQVQVGTLAVIATGFFMARTLIGMYLTKKTLFFLSHLSANATAAFISRVFNSGLKSLSSKSLQEYIFTITSGMNTLALGVLANAISATADLALLLVLSFGLVVFNPFITFLTFFLFAIVGLVLYFFMNVRAGKLGKANTQIHLLSMKAITESLGSYREIFVRNRIDFQADNLISLRRQHSDVLAGLNFLPSVSKYTIELFIVFFLFLISAIEFALVDALHAVATISVFLMASSRIAPAILRIQQSFINIKSSMGAAESSLELFCDFDNYPAHVPRMTNLDGNYSFSPVIVARNLSYSYGQSEILRGINFTVEAGSFVAIVGPSGAGKSTLIDVVLGLLDPTQGTASISGIPSSQAPSHFPGRISYLPQQVSIVSGSVAENICLGYTISDFSEEQIWAALEKAQASGFVKNFPQGIHTIIGDGGKAISGGERQRLGVARCLISDPELVVMDEATSALDGQTEHDLTLSILGLKGKKTILAVAHKLSTVQSADKILYMSHGQILAQGTFNQIKEEIPDFFAQANLSGL